MYRFYEWLKLILQEKISVFYKGAVSGWLLSGIFLFGSNLSNKNPIIVAYLIKVFAVAVTGLISGFATVLGNDLYSLVKAKFVKKKSSIKSKRKKAA